MPKKEKIFPLSTVGGRLQSLRHGANLSRSQFYDKVRPFGEAGSDSSKDKTVLNWESGKTQLDYDSLIAVCNILECDTDYLLGLQESPNKTYRHFSEETGLSEAAVESLIDPDKYGNRYGDIISALLENEELLSQITLCCKMDYTKVRGYERSVVLVAGENYHAFCRPEYVRQSNEMNVYNSLCNFIADFRKKNESPKKMRTKISKLIVKFTEKEYSFIEDNFGITKDKVDNFSDEEFYDLQDKCFDIEEAGGFQKRKDGALSEFIETAISIEDKIGDAIIMRVCVDQKENIKAPT